MDVLKAEEERFYETLENGMEILDAALAGQQVLPGEVAFKLHDTYGFPLDLSADVCRERGVASTRPASTPPWKSRRPQAAPPASSRWTACWTTPAPSTSSSATRSWKSREDRRDRRRHAVGGAQERPGRHRGAGLHAFYAESGGQVGDEGVLESGSASFLVQDTQKIKADVFGHHGRLAQGTLNVGDHVTAKVDMKRRAATMRNHSVTHLMHKALREVLGSRAAEGFAGGFRAHPLRLHAQRAGHAQQIREIEAR